MKKTQTDVTKHQLDQEARDDAEAQAFGQMRIKIEEEEDKIEELDEQLSQLKQKREQHASYASRLSVLERIRFDTGTNNEKRLP